MKNTILWVLFFLICMGVGFLHGVLPQGLSQNFTTPPKIQVLTTDEIFFPAELRAKLEIALNVKFSVLVTRDWDSIIANVVASPSVDLIFLPSFWAQTLVHQNLLSDVAGLQGKLKQKVASDFLGSQSQGDFFFLPFYWMKTGIVGPQGEPFPKFLANKKDNILFLLADEDLLLKHFQIWKEQGQLELIAQKKILTLQLDQIQTQDEHLGAIETPVDQESMDKDMPDQLGALLIWGAAIPANAPQKKLALEVLDRLSNTDQQEQTLLKTPFNSTFAGVISNDIPLQRRAEFIRNLQLKKTIILDRKDKDAKIKLRNEFNFIL